MGSLYLRARYYNVAAGAFFKEDSYLGNLREPLTLNRYVYCVGNPVNYVVPSGKSVENDIMKAVMSDSSIPAGCGRGDKHPHFRQSATIWNHGNTGCHKHGIYAEPHCKANSAAGIEEIELLLNAEDFGVNVYDCVFQRTEQIDLIDIQIHYPQIRFSNENDYRPPEILNKINRQIFEYVVSEDYFTWSDSRYNASVRYEISYVGNDYLSIIFEGDHYEFSREKVPSMLNFDLRTGEIISLEDYIEKDVIKERLAEDIGCIQEGEFIGMVGGREGVKEYLEAYLSEKGPLYDFAITEEGFKFIIYPEWSLGKEYYIADVFMQDTAFFIRCIRTK